MYGIGEAEQGSKIQRNGQPEIPKTFDQASESIREAEQSDGNKPDGDRYADDMIYFRSHTPHPLQPVYRKYPATTMTAMNNMSFNIFLKIFI